MDKGWKSLKRLVVLVENKQYTLMTVAYDCGFNSKTSFNRNFKKHTGLSPSELLKSVRFIRFAANERFIAHLRCHLS